MGGGDSIFAPHLILAMHRVVLVLTCLVLAACSQAQHATAPVSPAPDLPEEPASVAMAVPEDVPESPPTPGEKPEMPGVPLDDLIGMEMRPQAAALDEKQREAAAAFVASVPVRTGTLRVTVTADAARGASLYPSCSACHGERGEGNATLQAPRLAGQSDWYLVRQLDKYRAGSRGYVPEDIQGMQMRAAAAVLVSPEDVRDLVAYINSFSTAANQPTQESP